MEFKSRRLEVELKSCRSEVGIKSHEERGVIEKVVVNNRIARVIVLP